MHSLNPTNTGNKRSQKYTATFVRDTQPMPYANPFSNTTYDLLFCDNAELYRNELTISHYPWDILLSNESKTEDIKAIYNDTEMGTRPKIVACNMLLNAGVDTGHRNLMGLVLEMHDNKGLDVLAAYIDGGARFISSAENTLVWESKTAGSALLFERLFAQGNNALGEMVKWNSIRNNFPEKQNARLSFLTSSGTYFLEGELYALINDAFSGPVIRAGLDLITFLNEQKHNNSKSVFC